YGDSSTAARAALMPSVGVSPCVRAVATGNIRPCSSSAVTGRRQARRANAPSTVCAHASPPVSMLQVTTFALRVAFANRSATSAFAADSYAIPYPGDRRSADPTVSNSAPRSSAGNPVAGVSVVPSRSRTVLLYSSWFRRRRTTTPAFAGGVVTTLLLPADPVTPPPAP